ncbi:MAG: DUF2905 domain-containing protein [Ignavibacteria bacterium]|nr:DUF2905 domain-containing protein [Ignavibacteria bacterium]
MNEFQSIGKYLILTGIVIIIVGIIISFWDKIPLLGKLPGDIKIEGKNFTFYFPVVTSIILSIIISIILYFFKK